MSRAKDTLLFLAKYNSWRRGDETFEMPSPADIGSHIDAAVNLLRRYDDLEAKNERLERALRDAISTYDPNRAETFVSAERQEAWIEALNS